MDLPGNLLPTLRAVIAAMIPEDHDPGGLDLGCEAFIVERMRDDPSVAELYVKGLASLQAAGFETLSAEEQSALLSASPSLFVEQLAAHAVEAAYTHPRGLKMVGFEVTA